LARYHEQLQRDGARPRRCVGAFSFIYIGEWVDAIELAEKEIEENDTAVALLVGDMLYVYYMYVHVCIYMYMYM